MAIQKRLYRSRDDRIIAGVFGGLGEYYEIDPVVLRLAFIVVLVVTVFFPGILIYILAIFVMPPQPLVHADYEQSGSVKESNNSGTSSSTPETQSSPKTDATPEKKQDMSAASQSSNSSQPGTIPTPPSRRDDPLW